MRMLVMFVMRMPVLMLRHVVRMPMLVAFRQVQPQTDAHKAPGRHQLDGQMFIE